MNWELPEVQAGFREGRGTRYQIANICWIIEKPREFQKNIYFCFIDYSRAYDCVNQTNWKILKEMGMPDHLTCILRNPYAGQEATLELDLEQRTGSKLGKEYVKAIVCHSAYLIYMQSTSCEMSGGVKQKLESRLPGEILIPQICRLYHPYGRKWRRTKASLDETGEWKSWLKTQHSKN